MVAGINLFLGLFNNLAIFILLAAGYGFLFTKLLNEWRIRRQIVLGCFFGFFAIACMFVKIPVAKGVIVDQRNAIIVLSGIFGGPFSAIISAIIASAYRAVLGGSGVIAGIIGLTLSAISGIIANRLKKRVQTAFKVMIASPYTGHSKC